MEATILALKALKSSSSKTLELTTFIQKGDLAKKEEYNGTLRQTIAKSSTHQHV
jgi:hypothetical protein